MGLGDWGQGIGLGYWRIGALAHWHIGAIGAIGAFGHWGHWGIGSLRHWGIAALGHWGIGAIGAFWPGLGLGLW